jgi:hypothetical protein
MVLRKTGATAAAGIRSGSTAGVTLVELLIAISLSVVVVGMALALFKDAGFAAPRPPSSRFQTT